MSDWLLENKKCEYIDYSGFRSKCSLEKALEYYNDAAFLFLSKNGYGNISLCGAYEYYNSVEAVKHLIEDKGASAEQKGFGGMTPLQLARNKEVKEYLQSRMKKWKEGRYENRKKWKKWNE